MFVRSRFYIRLLDLVWTNGDVCTKLIAQNITLISLFSNLQAKRK